MLHIHVTKDPLQPRIRVLSPEERALMRAQLDKWIAQGYVVRSHAWVSCNPLWVDKADGSKRTCINYRPINAVTEQWDWPLPKIREIRYQIRDGVWFSVVDLKEAFHRIRIHPASQPLTAFSTPWGTFHFTRMPFGLCTAPATYQRFLDWVLHGLKERVINYVDDILVWGRTRRECVLGVARIRARLRHHNVEVNEAKCQPPSRQVVFVGLRISEGRIGCHLKMRDWAVPTTKQEWQSALGFANCFRDFLPGLSEKTAGLYPGTNQLPTAQRVEKARKLFAELEDHVSLHHYNDDMPADLHLDASQYAVGGVLSQQGKVCAIFSKSLTPAQTRYSATDREHVALLIGLESFRVMCQSNKQITTHTDHTALLNRKEEHMTPRQLRWKTRIEAITTNVVHVKGADNPADYWSRKGWKEGGDRWYA